MRESERDRDREKERERLRESERERERQRQRQRERERERERERLSDKVIYGVRYSENVQKLKMEFLLKLNINIITVSLECFSEKFLSQFNDKSL